MRMYDLIYAKKMGERLGDEAIAFWVQGVTVGTVPPRP